MNAIIAVALATLLAVVVFADKPVTCPDVDGDDIVLVPNPENCATYYSCDNGIAHLMPCSEGLHFNPAERVCDWPNQAGCEPSPPNSIENLYEDLIPGELYD